MSYGMKPNSGHKQAQRTYKAELCEMCGGTLTLQRHHKDGNPTNNEKSNVMVVCQPCHVKIHCLIGNWGKGNVKQSACKICGQIFKPKRTRRSKLCGKPECLKENGRQSAGLRWR